MLFVKFRPLRSGLHLHMKRNKKPQYPPSRYNPAYQARQIDKLAEQLRTHQQHISAISKSHDNHITYLANFARHDIKNAIQNMDSILSTTGTDEFDEKVIASLNTYLLTIRTTLDNFAKLVPYSGSDTFTLDSLLIAMQLISRANTQMNHIETIFDYPRNTGMTIQLPFQVVLQMMNNLIINSIKSLEEINAKKMLVQGSIEGTEMIIAIKDNGAIIESSDSKRIFDYGYSTTGGSGIGLYHALYLCNEFKGSIRVDLTKGDNYNKTFIVRLPITVPQNGKDSNHN